MRELTVRIRFVTPCLGNVKELPSGRYRLPRSPDRKRILFQATWHHTNMALAAQLLGRHQDAVKQILWDVFVDGQPRKYDGWHPIYYTNSGSRTRHVLYEAFLVGQTIGLNCTVPPSISDEDFWSLMQKAGQYRGLSPHRPEEFGRYEVVGIRPRRMPQVDTQELNLLPEEAEMKTKRAD